MDELLTPGPLGLSPFLDVAGGDDGFGVPGDLPSPLAGSAADTSKELSGGVAVSEVRGDSRATGSGPDKGNPAAPGKKRRVNANQAETQKRYRERKKSKLAELERTIAELREQVALCDPSRRARGRGHPPRANPGANLEIRGRKPPAGARAATMSSRSSRRTRTTRCRSRRSALLFLRRATSRRRSLEPPTADPPKTRALFANPARSCATWPPRPSRRTKNKKSPRTGASRSRRCANASRRRWRRARCFGTGQERKRARRFRSGRSPRRSCSTRTRARCMTCPWRS